MAFWFNRYKHYTKRGEVYLFTLRDYCEFMLIKQYGGCYLVRKGVPEKAGYLMQFPEDQLGRIAAFIEGESTLAYSNDGSLVTGQKPFITEEVSLSAVGDGTTKDFRIAEHLTNIAEDYSVSVDGTAKPVTKDAETGALSFTGGTIDPASGTVSFTAAPAADAEIELKAVQVKFTLNYQLLGDILFAGLGMPDAPVEVTVPSTALDADGTAKDFQLPENLKKGTVKITFKPDEDSEAIGPITDNEGVFSVTTSGDSPVTTVYGHVSYVTGLLQMESAPVELSFEAHYYKKA